MSMCENRSLRTSLKQCLSDTCFTTKQAVQETFFELLGKGTCKFSFAGLVVTLRGKVRITYLFCRSFCYRTLWKI